MTKPSELARIPDDAAEVLRFWLGAYPLDGAAMQRVQQQWFQKDADFDQELGRRFGATLAAARAGQLDAWADAPESWLALLIVLDQFSRNMFRDSPQAFASDVQAVRVAEDGLARGLDHALPPMARIFCYLPLEHAESLERQARSVALFRALAANPEALPGAFFAGTLDYALKHQDVIERYGRFPHRNAILGRASTEAEQVYLAQPGAGF